MADYDTRLIGAGASTVTRDGIGSFLIWFGQTEPDPPGTGETLDNPSFELPGSDGGVAAVDWPADWEADGVAFGFTSAVFGSPFRWAETFEGRWDDNHNAITAFDEGTHLTQGTFGAWPLETNYEGFHQSWALGNQDALDEYEDDVTYITAGAFNAALDPVEEFEAEWQARHAVADIAREITPTWFAFNLATTITRLNEIKSKWNAHLADAAVHGGTADATNTITSPDATDGASAQALAEEMWNNEVWDHIVDGAGTWHRVGYTKTLLGKPTYTDFATIDSDDEAWRAALLLTVFCNLHFTWESNSGPGFYDAFEDFGFTPTNIYAVPWSDDPTSPDPTDDFEDDWGGNQNWLPVFGGGDITAGQFEPLSNTYEDLENATPLPISLAAGSAGAAVDIDPSHGVFIAFGGTLTGTLRVEARRNKSGEWLTISDVELPLPTEVDVANGYKQVRVYTVAYTSGSPTADMRFGRLATL